MGAAVGGSLGGAACICGMLAVFIRERKKRKEIETQMLQQQQQLQQQLAQAQAQVWAYNKPPGYPAEAGGQPYVVQPSELDTQPLHELGGRKSSLRGSMRGSYI